MNSNRQNELKKQLRKSKRWLIAAGVAILTLPVVLTKTPCCIFDFSDTGQVGDTMGGIMGPFIAILAVWFTFKAFWVQFEANEAQKDINEQQRKDIAKERFENKFYELIHLHRDNMLELNHNGNEGRSAAASSCYHLVVLYSLIDNLFVKYYQDNEEVIKKYNQLAESVGGYQKLFVEITYNLFFYGKEYIQTLPKEKNSYLIYSKVVEMLSKACKEAHFNHDDIIEFPNKLNSEVERYLTRDKKFDIYGNEIVIPKELLKGNHASFGIYFRQFYQIVKFVAKSDILSENERYDYIKVLRSQLSDFEQILLYYNGLSIVGKKWNIAEPPNQINDSDSWRENMKLIARFKLIKNIPASFHMFGVTPEEYYKEEMKSYEDRGIAFFEWK